MRQPYQLPVVAPLLFAADNVSSQSESVGSAVTDTQIAVGIDLGGTTFSVAAFSRAGEMLAYKSHPTPDENKAAPLLNALASGACEIIEEVGERGAVAGLGIGIPGPVVPQTGLIKQCPNLHALDGIVVTQELSGRLNGVPCFVGNDAYCATLAELRYGAGADVENIVMLTLGTGIGGGVAMRNEVIRGPRQILGEVGHLIIQPGGPKCGCGNRGCFEAVAAKDAIIDLAVRALQAGKHSVIMDLVAGDVRRITPEIISQAAADGDRIATEVYERIGNFIGIALCNCIVLCDPDRIILGGGIAAAGETLFGPIRRTVAARSMISGFDVTQIVPAQLGNNAGALGAAALVWE